MSAGGGAMADAFINLGDKLHNNFSANMDSAFQNRNTRNALAENKRQFDISSMFKKQEMAQRENEFDRSSGQSAIQALANQRAQAMASFNNQKLKDAFYRS